MATLKVPVVIDGVKTIEELANRVLDEFEYNGKTIREWADLITNPKTNADRIRCPLCGGTLSEVRENKGKRYRHCYSCHLETDEDRLD